MQLSASGMGVHGNVSCREGPAEVFLFATGDVAFPRFAGKLVAIATNNRVRRVIAGFLTLLANALILLEIGILKRFEAICYGGIAVVVGTPIIF